jgi:hypothetical protein
VFAPHRRKLADPLSAGFFVQIRQQAEKRRDAVVCRLRALLEQIVDNWFGSENPFKGGHAAPSDNSGIVSCTVHFAFGGAFEKAGAPRKTFSFRRIRRQPSARCVRRRK